MKKESNNAPQGADPRISLNLARLSDGASPCSDGTILLRTDKLTSAIAPKPAACAAEPKP